MSELKEQYRSDLDFLLSIRHHLGGDYWTTEDLRVGKGSPFSARDVAIMLSELGYSREDDIIKGLATAIFKTWKPDGRFKISPSGAIYPCHTITALRVLCYLGYTDDERLQTTFDHLREIQHEDGGWRCNKVKMGKSPDMDRSNPGVTLEALDAFRHTAHLKKDKDLDKAVDFLLDHWEIRRPLGPCHFGIGTLFMQTEFPFLRYNLLYYCHTLSFYENALKDSRFKEVLGALKDKVVDGKIIVENPNRRLAKLSFCKKGEASDLATQRYKQILERCGN
jgi:hypothetical protein